MTKKQTLNLAYNEFKEDSLKALALFIESYTSYIKELEELRNIIQNLPEGVPEKDVLENALRGIMCVKDEFRSHTNLNYDLNRFRRHGGHWIFEHNAVYSPAEFILRKYIEPGLILPQDEDWSKWCKLPGRPLRPSLTWEYKV